MLRSRHISERIIILQRFCARNTTPSTAFLHSSPLQSNCLPVLQHVQIRAASNRSTLQQQREQEGLTVPSHGKSYPPSIMEEVEPPYVARSTRRRPQQTKNKANLQRESQLANKAFQLFQQAQRKTEELLQKPTGDFVEADWRTAQELIQYWCTAGIHKKNALQTPQKLPQAAVQQSVGQSFDLLDRLVREQQSITTENVSLSKAILQPSLLETILRNWKQFCRQNRRSSSSSHNTNAKNTTKTPMSPSEVLSKMKELTEQSTSLCFIGPRLYNIIMDVAIKRGIQDNKNLRQKASKDFLDGYTPVQATPEMLETAEFIESIVETMILDPNIQPDAVTYCTVIQAWSLVGNGPRAHHFLQQVCDSYQRGHQQNKGNESNNNYLLRPDRGMFHSVLRAYARGPNTGTTMDESFGLVQQMQKLHDEYSLEIAPDTKTYNIILSCLANNPMVHDAVTQAEEIFHHRMAGLHDAKSYNTVLDIYAKLRMPVKAEALLEQMYDEYLATQNREIEPSVKSFNIVLSAWTRAGNSAAVERLFALMEELHSSGMLRQVAPNFITYSIVLENWAQQVGKLPGACDRAEAILYTMNRLAEAGNKSLQPSTVTYSILLKALAKRGDAARAEQILGDMMDEVLRHNNKRVRPDLTTFNTVLVALSRSDQHDAVHRIRTLMARMEELSDDGRFGNLRPDTRSWNSLLQAVARSGTKGAGVECEKILEIMKSDAKLEINTISYATAISSYARDGLAEDAERLLQRICDEYYKCRRIDDRGGERPVKPSVKLFTNVLTAWSKRGTPEAADKAESLFRQLKDMILADDVDGVIDTVFYNALLGAWAGSSRQDIGQRVEEILLEMESDVRTKPDTITYNTALNAFARLGNAERCQEFFDRMVEKSKTMGSRIAPDFHTLCTLLKAWSKATSIEDDNDQARHVFQKLQELSTKTGISANVACYNVVLDCLARTKKEETLQIAEDLLYEMERIAANESTDTRPEASARPNTVSYSTLINGYGNIGDAEKAEMILERMLEKYIQTGESRSHLRPSVECFNSALAAWSKKAKQKSSPDAPARAEAILGRMRRLSKTTGLPIMPNVVSYNIVLDCWGNSGLEDAGSRAESILNDMLQSEEGIFPETRTYNTVMAAFARSGNYKKVEAFLESMYDTYNKKTMSGQSTPAKPNIVTWNTLLSAYARSRSPVALQGAEETLRRMGKYYDAGLLEVKANTISYNNMLNCLAKAKRNHAGERCEAILAEMEARAAAGEEHLKPTATSYSATIQAWIKRHNYERAQELLLRLCDAYDNGDHTMKPTIETFRSVLKCISTRTPGDDVTDAAYFQIRERMKQLHPRLMDVEFSPGNAGAKEEVNAK